MSTSVAFPIELNPENVCRIIWTNTFTNSILAFDCIAAEYMPSFIYPSCPGVAAEYVHSTLIILKNLLAIRYLGKELNVGPV